MALPSAIIMRDTRANQPAATAVADGTLYYVTDELVTERSNGAAWQSVSDAGSTSFASTAEVRTGTSATKALSPDNVFDAAAIVALTPGTNVSLDLSTGFNFSLAMNGDYTLDNPTNTKVGQSGVITCTQDGTGTQTLAFGTNYEFAGGTPIVLSTAAGAKDHIFYYVESSTSIFLTIQKAVS